MRRKGQHESGREVEEEREINRETHVLRSKKLSIDRPDEVSVEKSSILNGLGEHNPDESEEGEMIWVDRTELVELVGRSSAGRGFELRSKKRDEVRICEDQARRRCRLTRAKLGLKIDLARTLVKRKGSEGQLASRKSRRKERRLTRTTLEQLLRHRLPPRPITDS